MWGVGGGGQRNTARERKRDKRPRQTETEPDRWRHRETDRQLIHREIAVPSHPSECGAKLRKEKVLSGNAFLADTNVTSKVQICNSCPISQNHGVTGLPLLWLYFAMTQALKVDSGLINFVNYTSVQKETPSKNSARIVNCLMRVVLP